MLARTATAALTALLLAGSLHPAASAAPPLPGGASPGEWSLAAVPPGPDGRAWHNVVHAPELGLVIVFGGYTERGVDDDVFWLDPADPGAGWQTLPPGAPGPGPRYQASAAWDPVGHRLLVFGGAANAQSLDDIVTSGTARNDLWALTFDPDGQATPAWSRLHDGQGAPALAPAPRGGAAAIYDPVGRRLVLHGGTDLIQTFVGLAGDLAEAFTGVRTTRQGFDDTWAFDIAGSGGWTRLAGGPADPALFLHQGVYDPESRQLVVAGGETSTFTYSSAVHAFDLATHTWSTWDPAGEDVGIADGAYGYSPSLGALVAMPGEVDWENGVDTRGVYALTLGPGGQGARWSALPVGGSPHRPRSGVRGVVAGDRLLAFGGVQTTGTEGYDNDATLSAYDVADGSWRTLLPETESMPANADAASALDPQGRHLYVVGGKRWDRVVWDLDLAAGVWRRVRAPGSVPEGHEGMAAVFDERRDRLIVMGAGDHRLWALDVADPGARWERLDPAGDGPGLAYHTLLFDPVRDRVLALGGRHHAPGYDWGYFGSWQRPDLNEEVYALELAGPTPTWHTVPTSGPAPQLDRGVAVYDPRRDRVLTFGGFREAADVFNPTARTNEVHELRLADGSWRTVEATGEVPRPRSRFVGALDLAGDRLVVWGGEAPAGDTATAIQEEATGEREAAATFALDLASANWSRLQTTDDPLPRIGATGGYDPAGRRLVAFGGYGERGDEGIVGSRDVVALALGGGAIPAPPPASPAVTPLPEIAPVRGGSWDPIGPPRSNAVSLAFSGEALLAGTLHGPGQDKTDPQAGGVYRSTDGGATWSAADGPIRGAAVTRLAVAPSDPSRVYAAAIGTATRPGLYVSDDAGASWRRADDGLAGTAHWGLAVHPEDPDVAWTGGKAGGVYRTNDGGETWTRSDLGLEGQEAFGLAALPTPGGARVLAATRDLDARVTGDGRAYVSDDGGETWDQVLSTDDLTYAFAVDPAAPSRVLLAAGNGIWSSEDAGDSWVHVNVDGIHAAGLAFDPTSDGGVVYAGGVSLDPDFGGFAGGDIPPFTPGLFRSTDGGRTWADLGAVPAEEDVGGVAVSADGATVAAASISSGVYLGTGETWARAVEGMTQSPIQGVGADAADPGRLVGGAHYQGVAVTEDGGATWEAVATSDAAMQVEASPVTSGRVLAASWQVVLKSENGGGTWSTAWQQPGQGTTASYLQPGTIGFHPSDPDTWYVLRSNGQVTITHDNGASFTSVATGAGSTACQIPIASAPDAPDTILVGDTCGAGVFRSEDGGATWASSSAGLLDGNVMSLAVAPGGAAYAGTLHRGVWRSEDGGRTWEPSRTGLGYRYVKRLLVDPADPSRVFAAVDELGVYESDDGGRTWRPIRDGLTSTAVVDLETGTDGSIYVSTDGGGVLRLEPGGG